MTRLVGLDLVGSPDPWAALGLAVDDDGAIGVGEVTLRFGAAAPGLRVWSPDDEIAGDLDGVRVIAGEPVSPSASSEHTLCASAVDHIVVMTSSLGRTTGAASGLLRVPLKRERDAGGGVRQGFFRLGEVILEVVESPQVLDGPASFWGLVLIVDDLVGVCDRLGPEVIGQPKSAVQRGRYIASIRPTAGLGCPVALMSA